MARKYRSISVTAIVVAMMAAVYCDVYMHNMRGSNNRLDEQNNNRDNDNRLFDSQNNDNGGYNVGHMYYYGGSKMSIYFTAQHGSGIANLNNNFVLQYSCQEQMPGLRDGTSTQTIPDDAENSRANQFGQHETYSYYQKCKARGRNKGLYIANQNVGEKAIHTRQNNNGNRHGFECPEERDYYPYWHPTPWIDIAVMTSNTSMCGYYQSESQNVKVKNECSNPQYNNNDDCIRNGATWNTVQPWGVAAPACLESCISRDNHLGNSPNGYPCKIDFDMPILQSTNCVLRLRYNVSTNDYPPWNTFADKNDQIRNQNGQNVQNPNPVILGVYPEATDTTKRSIRMQNDPTIDIGIGVNLQMNINPAQFFRTFEDRSHTFEIRRSPVSGTIWNLNVQGKRGNIVQVYPAVEYDFVPYNLRVKPGEYIHFQWTGTNNNNGGNAGQGRAGTDRNNIMVMEAKGKNFPVHLVNQTVFGDYFDALTMAFSGMPGGVTNTLDAAGAYFDGGLVQMNNIGTFAMVSTRNNQFTNRSQKTVLTVDYDGLSPGAIAGVTIGTTAGVGAAAAGGFALFKFRTKIPFLRGF